MGDIFLKEESVGKIVKGREDHLQIWKANVAWIELSVGDMAEFKLELWAGPSLCVVWLQVMANLEFFQSHQMGVNCY